MIKNIFILSFFYISLYSQNIPLENNYKINELNNKINSLERQIVFLNENVKVINRNFEKIALILKDYQINPNNRIRKVRRKNIFIINNKLKHINTIFKILKDSYVYNENKEKIFKIYKDNYIDISNCEKKYCKIRNKKEYVLKNILNIPEE